MDRPKLDVIEIYNCFFNNIIKLACPQNMCHFCNLPSDSCQSGYNRADLHFCSDGLWELWKLWPVREILHYVLIEGSESQTPYPNHHSPNPNPQPQTYPEPKQVIFIKGYDDSKLQTLFSSVQIFFGQVPKLWPQTRFDKTLNPFWQISNPWHQTHFLNLKTI